MNATEILKEIEGLSPSERREVSKRLFELEEDSGAIQFSLHAADIAFRMLDEMEAEDGPN